MLLPRFDTTLLYVATYGSAERKSGQKTSQVIQLDRERAAELIQIIRDVFPGIEHDKV